MMSLVLVLISLVGNSQTAEEFYHRGQKKEYELNDYNGAILDYTKAIAINPKFKDAYIARGFTKFFLKDYTGAIADYTMLLPKNKTKESHNLR